MLVSIDYIAVKNYLENVGSKAGSVLAAAVNETAKQTKKTASDAVFSQVNLKRSYINSPKRLRVTRAIAKHPNAALIADRRNTLLSVYPHSKRKGTKIKGSRKRAGSGIVVRVKRGGAKKLLASAFSIRLRSGSSEGSNGQGIAHRKTGSMRYPIEVLSGPSVFQLSKQSIFNNLVEPTGNLLEANVKARVDRLIAKAKG